MGLSLQRERNPTRILQVVSHVFSSQDQDPGPQRLSAEEAKELIRNYQHREAALDSQVTIQDMAETLGLPTWQVAQMVQDLRAKQQFPSAPMPAGEWLKTRLWMWALAAVGVMAIASSYDRLTPSLPHRPNRDVSDGIYDHDKVVQGRAFGMTSPPGFSYEIKYDNVDAAANGDSRHYMPVDDLSPTNRAIIQGEYADAIADGMGKAVAHVPPHWVNGEAVGRFRPNYYDAGLADGIDLTLHQDAFPYDPKTPAGKALHDEILKDVQDHWGDITD